MLFVFLFSIGSFPVQTAFFLFITFILLAGLWTGRRVKSIRDYALANRSLNTGILVVTCIATLIGAGDLRGIASTAEEGIANLFFPALMLINMLLVGKFIAPKIYPFKGAITMGDITKQLYGKEAALFTSLITFFFCTLLIAGEIEVMGSFTSSMLGKDVISPQQAIILLGGVVIIYAVLGGMRSIAFTDLFQWGALMTLLIILAAGVLKFFGLFELSQKITDHHLLFGWQENHATTQERPFDSSTLILTPLKKACFGGLIPTFLCSPPIVQRMLMVKNKEEAKKMLWGSALFYALIRLLLFIIGMAGMVKYFMVNGKVTEVPDKDFMPALVLQLFPQQSWANILLLISMLSVLMSTADSFLHAGGILAVHDLWRPFSQQQESKTTVTKCRIATLLLGVLAISMAIYAEKLQFGTWMGYTIYSIHFILIPFLLGVIGLKTAPQSFWTFVATFLATSILGYYMEWSLEATSLIANGIGVISWLITHYVIFKAFVRVNRETLLPFETSSWRLGNTKSWQRVLSTPFRLHSIAKHKVSVYGTNPFLFGIIVFTTHILFFLPLSPLQEGKSSLFLAKGVFLGGILFGSILLWLKEHWPKVFQPLYPLAWFTGLFVCFPFAGMSFFLLHPQAPLALFKCIAMLWLLVLFTDISTACSLTILGLSTAVIFHQAIWGTPIAITHHPILVELSLGLVITFLGAILLKVQRSSWFKRQRMHLKEENNYQLEQITEALAAQRQLSQALNPQGLLLRDVKEAVDQVKECTSPTCSQVVPKVEEAIAQLSQIGAKATEHLPLSPSLLHIETLVKDTLNTLQYEYDTPIYDVVLHDKAFNNNLVGDPMYLRKLISNGIQYCARQHPGETVHIEVGSTGLVYQRSSEINPAFYLAISPEKNIPPVHESYKVRPDTSSYIERQQLHENNRIVEAHDGFMQLLETGQKRKEIQCYIFPKDITELHHSWHDAGTKELENKMSIDTLEDQAFLQLVRKHPTIDINKVSLALKVAKYHHKGQKRYSGELYYLHVLSVAEILLNYTKDTHVVIAGLLHDIITHTKYTFAQLEETFGAETAYIIQQMIRFYGRYARQRKNSSFYLDPTQIFEVVEPDALLVKLADRLHNMRTIKGHDDIHKRRTIAQETLHFFVPAARLLKLSAIEKELEELAEKALHKDKIA